ncbi:MAG: DrmE family protein [Sediminibacterium sp.]|nr:DrmE family protein [Sediminibacterium sp.]
MMNKELIQRLEYSYTGEKEAFPLPLPLKDSLQLISDFFLINTTNKLCLVFPSKEYAAQWLTVPTVLFLIESDFAQFRNEIVESLEKYKRGDWIILNNEAVVEWVGRNVNGFIFKHKEYNGVDEITISIKKISKIQPAPSSRKALSGYKRVIEALAKTNENPTDKILGIQTEGNKLYQKNAICLISKHISFENSISEISINNFLIDEYFKQGKIDDTGEADMKSPLLISNNLTNLALYVTLSDTVSKIIIDGYSAIQERGVDFNDIDVKKIPTILITDLSEVGNFENIGEYGFDFYNFTKENLQLDEIKKLSPFSSFDKKLHKYVSFNLKKEICENADLESITKLIHSIDKDESVKELMNLKILLIQLTNLVSRIAHPLKQNEVAVYKEMLSKMETLFFENRFYLGGSLKAIKNSISLLKSVIEKFANAPSEKCARLDELMKANQYDYIICTTEDEALSLSLHLNSLHITHRPNVISVADVNNSLLDYEPVKAILTGWAKTNNVNRLLSSFLFSELTVLFYQFESRYFNSLQNRNKKFSGNVKSTINKKGIRSEKERETENGFAELYKSELTTDTDSNFDIAEFELKLDNAQFSKYIVRGNLADSVKAKRVEFKNDRFIYLTDTHGLLVLENFHQSTSKSLYIHKNRIENLHHGDVIAFLKTERELLNKIVARQTTPAALAETNKWIELWKNSLKNHYKLLNNDFNKLAKELKEQGCDRDPVTIRSWLFDDLRIGPRKDDDLIAIAIMTNGTELSDNINQVRVAIRQMTSWRMKASDFVIEQLKAKIKSTHSTIQVNSIIDFEDLGEVEILEITEINNSPDNIDIRNVNRLLEKAKL